MDQAWRIFKVKPGHEVETAKSARVPAYVPRRLHSYYDRRRRVTVTRTPPMLPGFVFLSMDAPPNRVFDWPRPHHMGYMRNVDRSYALLTPKAFAILVETEHEMLNPQAEEATEGPEVRLPGVGDRVEILNHRYFDHLQGLVKTIRGDRVLVELVKASVRVELSLRGDEIRLV